MGPTRGQTLQCCQPARRGWHGTVLLAAGASARRVPISNEHLLQLQPEQPPVPKACDCLNQRSKCTIIKDGTAQVRRRPRCSADALAKRATSPAREWSLLHGERQDIQHPPVPPVMSYLSKDQLDSCTQEIPGSPKFTNAKAKSL